jgi:hypothetical protein
MSDRSATESLMTILYGDGHVDGSELAFQLAARLRDLLPPPLSVAAEDGFLVGYHSPGSALLQLPSIPLQ